MGVIQFQLIGMGLLLIGVFMAVTNFLGDNHKIHCIEGIKYISTPISDTVMLDKNGKPIVCTPIRK